MAISSWRPIGAIFAGFGALELARRFYIRDPKTDPLRNQICRECRYINDTGDFYPQRDLAVLEDYGYGAKEGVTDPKKITGQFKRCHQLKTQLSHAVLENMEASQAKALKNVSACNCLASLGKQRGDRQMLAELTGQRAYFLSFDKDPELDETRKELDALDERIARSYGSYMGSVYWNAKVCVAWENSTPLEAAKAYGLPKGQRDAFANKVDEEAREYAKIMND